jgi:two-component system chemotaxis response regulator CheY
LKIDHGAGAMAKYRCMIVEDSPTMRQLIVSTLRRIPQLEIVEASDGVDALAKLPGRKTDLVLADAGMPIMGGQRLMGLLKSNPLYREIPVVIIAAAGAAEDREKSLALGARAYLPKPIQPNNLLKVVRDILDL